MTFRIHHSTIGDNFADKVQNRLKELSHTDLQSNQALMTNESGCNGCGIKTELVSAQDKLWIRNTETGNPNDETLYNDGRLSVTIAGQTEPITTYSYIGSAFPEEEYEGNLPWRNASDNEFNRIKASIRAAVSEVFESDNTFYNQAQDLLMNANQYNPSNHKKIVLASEINQIPNGMEGEFLGREVYSQRKHGNVNSFVQQFLTSHLASIESDSNQALVILLSRQSLTAFKHSSMKPSSTRKPL